MDTIERVVSVAPNRKYKRMTVFSSFSFKDVYFVSALTEYCGLSFQLKVLLCVAAGTAGLLIQAEFRLTQTAGRHLFWGGKITLEMRLLI